MFIGRKKELETLEDLLFSNRFEMPIIYGRRRIGKTTLIKEFVKGKRSIFFTATQSRAEDNLEKLTQSINMADSRVKIRGELKNFHQAFEVVADIAKERESPLIFIIDEYPYLAKSDASVSSVLQEVIDHVFLEQANLMLILSGSSMSFMEKQVLGYESPLYGRRTAQFKIEAMSPWEAIEFFPDMDKVDFLTIYGITGGIPLYLSMMDGHLTLKDNILKHFFQPNTFLFEEPENFLKQELKNSTNYNSIIEAIATDSSKFNEIATKTQIAPSSLDANLVDLVELGIVEKKKPLGSTGKKSSIYLVSDGLFAFWYAFVPQNRVLIESDKQELIWQGIQEKLNGFTAKIFEKFCIAWLKDKNGEGIFKTIIAEIGSWWGRNPYIRNSGSPEHEIDILAFGQNKNDLLIGECKWRKDEVGSEVLELLLERSTFFPRPSKEMFLFSKSGYTANCIERAAEERVYLIKYEDMI